MAQYTEEEKLEQDTIKFLKKLGFKDVNGGKNFFVGGRQIDACGGHEKTLLVVECTTKKDISSKIDEFRGRIDFFRQDLLTHNVYKKYQKHKYILVIKNQEITETILGKSNKGMKIYLWNEKFIAFYQQLESAIKINARYSLLSEIDVKPEKTNPIEIPAFQAKVGMKSKYKIFSFLIDAKDLMEISFVARREMGGELFYQRMVNKSRLKEIASEYIDTGEKIFPNNIIVALADNSWEFKNEEIGIDMPNWLEFGKLKIGNSYNSCWIIDGQHRLFSHAHTTNKGKLTVSAFANIDEENQAEYFLDINRKARPVSPELLWDILGTIKPTSAEGIISNAVKDLRNSQSGFFEDNIKIPSLGTGKFSFHNLCDSLNKMEFGDKVLGFIGHKKNNPFSNNSHEKHSRNLAKAINNYFVEFDLRINDLIKPHLYSDGFISVLIYLYKILIVHFGKVPSKAELDPFLNIFCKNFEALSEEEATQVRKNLTSEGAKAQYRNSLVMYLQEKYDKNFGAGFIKHQPSLANGIKDLELEFNRFIFNYLDSKLGEDWFDDNQYYSDNKSRDRYKGSAKKKGLYIWEVMNFNSVVQEIVARNNLWDQYFGEMFSQYGIKSQEELRVFATKIWDYRSNEIGHARQTVLVYSKDELNMFQSIYRIFKKLITQEERQLQKEKQ